MKSNPGPWNLYEHTPPRGIKKKVDLEKERAALAAEAEKKHHEESKTEEVKETVQPESAPIVNETSESKKEDEKKPATEPVEEVTEVQQLAGVETMVENLSLKEDGQTELVTEKEKDLLQEDDAPK